MLYNILCVHTCLGMLPAGSVWITKSQTIYNWVLQWLKNQIRFMSFKNYASCASDFGLSFFSVVLRSTPWPLLELLATQRSSKNRIYSCFNSAKNLRPALPISPNSVFQGRCFTNELYAPFTWAYISNAVFSSKHSVWATDETLSSLSINASLSGPDPVRCSMPPTSQEQLLSLMWTMLSPHKWKRVSAENLPNRVACCPPLANLLVTV